MHLTTNRVRNNPWRPAFTAAAALLVALTALPQVARAADDEPKTSYTRVELWQVERAQWGDFVEMFETHDQPILEKLMADGMITEWGIDAMGLHHPEGYTHSVWYSADSLGAVVKAGKAYEDAWEAMAGDNLKKMDAEFASMITKHRDYMIDTEIRSVAATLDGGYYHAHSVLVSRGKHRQFHSYWDHRIKPVLESLLEKGTVVTYGLSTENITTDNPMAHSWWYVVRDADGLDAVDAAFDADWDAMDDEGKRERWTSILDVIDEDSYREDFTSIIHWSIKAQ